MCNEVNDESDAASRIAIAYGGLSHIATNRKGT